MDSFETLVSVFYVWKDLEPNIVLPRGFDDVPEAGSENSKGKIGKLAVRNSISVEFLMESED